MHKKIKQLRKRKGMTMKALAEAAGTSQQQIDRLEKGKRRLTLEWMHKLSQALECDLTDLLPASEKSRDISSTAKTKVIGAADEKGMIKSFDDKDIYQIIFGRPKRIMTPRMFAIVITKGKIHGFSEGDELIFSEIEDGDEKKIESGGIVICAEKDGDGKIRSHSIKKFPTSNSDGQIKAALIKSIRNE